MIKDDAQHTERPLRLLVVDHDSESLELTKRRLEEEGHRVTTRTSASRIQMVINALRPDIVLIEALMPGLTGQDLVRLLRAYPAKGTPAIIVVSTIPERALRHVVDLTDALGVLRKTSDDVVFFFAFHSILDRLPETRGVDGRRRATPPIASGKHRISVEDDPVIETAEAEAEAEVEAEDTTQVEVTRRWVLSTSPGRR
jgi:CheY-like chemotaxis protein